MTLRSAILTLALLPVLLTACAREEAPPADRDVALRRLVAHLAVKDDAAAVADLRAYLQRVPDDPVMRYNLACLDARRGEVDQALTELRLALRHGYRRLDQVRQDPDLASLQADPRLEALLTAHADTLTAAAASATIKVSGDQWSDPRPLVGGGTVRVRVTVDALEVATDVLTEATAGWLVVAVPSDPAAYESSRWFQYQLQRQGDRLVAEPATATASGSHLSVPWSSLVPHQPPLDLLLGLNLVLDTPAGRRSLVVDPLLAAGDVGWRRYAPLVIDPGERPLALLTARPDTRLAIGDTVAVEVACQGQADGEVLVSMLVDGDEVAALPVFSEFGLGYDTALLPLGADGARWVSLAAAAGELRWSGQVFHLPSDWFLTRNAALEAVAGVEQDIVRFWLFRVLRGQQGFDPRSDPTPLAEAVAAVEALLARQAATGSVLPDSATVMAVAVRTGGDALVEARVCLPPTARRPAATAATLVLVDDAMALDRVAADLHAHDPDRLVLVLPAAPTAGADGATVARIHAAGQWLRKLVPAVKSVDLVGVGRAATSAVLAAMVAPSAWSRLRLWADWTLDPWPLVADGALVERVPPGLAALTPSTSLPAGAGARAAAVASALGGTLTERHGDDRLADWLAR